MRKCPHYGVDVNTNAQYCALMGTFPTRPYCGTVTSSVSRPRKNRHQAERQPARYLPDWRQ